MKRPVPTLLAALAAVVLAIALSGSVGAGNISARDQARETAASAAYSAALTQFKAGTAVADSVYLWSVRWLESEKKTKTALSAAQAHLARMRTLQSEVKSKVSLGVATGTDEKGAVYYVAEAEVWVTDAGGTP